MKSRIAGTLSSLALILSCHIKTTKSTQNDNTYPVTDSINLNAMNVWLKFNDHGLFDTTFVFTQYYGFCAFGVDLSKSIIQPRFSNKKFNNGDSTRFGIIPKEDSLLYLSFYCQIIDTAKNISKVESKSKLEIENLERVAMKRLPYSKFFFHEFKIGGVPAGIFGAESTVENGRTNFSKLEVFAVYNEIKITAYFQYSGEGSHNYLNDFFEIAKTMRVEK